MGAPFQYKQPIIRIAHGAVFTGVFVGMFIPVNSDVPWGVGQRTDSKDVFFGPITEFRDLSELPSPLKDIA